MTDGLPDELVTLTKFTAPQARPTSRAVKTYRQVKKKVLDRDTETADAVPDTLERSTERLIDPATWDTLDQHVFDVLDKTYGDWAKGEGPSMRARTCLTLPSASEDLFARWAETRGFALLDPEQFMSDSDVTFAVLPTVDGLIDRSPAGLERLRAFCEAVDQSAARLLMCATTVQWSWLSMVGSIDLIAEDCLILPPFKAQHLCQLIGVSGPEKTLKSRASGEDILALDEDEPVDAYLQDLAAEARGCPWGALQVLDHAVTRVPDDESECVWVGRPDWPVLPGNYARLGQFVLHGLLLYGSLPAKRLGEVMGRPLPPGLPDVMERLGFIQRDDSDVLRIAPQMVAYVRSDLFDAGFPLDTV